MLDGNSFIWNCEKVSEQLNLAENMQDIITAYCLRIDDIASKDTTPFYRFTGKNPQVNDFLRNVTNAAIDEIIWDDILSWTESAEGCYFGWITKDNIRCTVVGIENPNVEEDASMGSIAAIAMILYLRLLKD